MNAAARVVSDTCKYNGGLKSEDNIIHWPNVSERIEYNIQAWCDSVPVPA